MGRCIFGRQENRGHGCCTANRSDNHFLFEDAHGVHVYKSMLAECSVVAPKGCQIGLCEGGVFRFRVNVVEIVAVDEDVWNVRMPQLIRDFVPTEVLPTPDLPPISSTCWVIGSMDSTVGLR